MARKKKIQKTQRKIAQVHRAAVRSAVVQDFRWAESYTSLLLGIAVVLIAAFGLVSFVKGKRIALQTPSIPSAATDIATQQKSPVAPKKPNPPAEKIVTAPGETVQNKTTVMSPSADSYVVAAGDNLWSISEKIYNSGYNWVDIAKANNIENPGLIYAGQKLAFPKVETKILAASNDSNMAQAPPVVDQTQPQVSDQPSKITGDSYTIKHGDDLWDIAVRAYGDGFRWPEIAQANNLTNPSIIHGDNVLKIPRS